MSRLDELRDRLHEKPMPRGWRLVPLGDLVAEAQTGFACGLRAPEGVIQLRMNNVDTRGSFVWSDLTRVPAEPDQIAQFQLCSGDVMFNNTNSTELVGKSALFEGYPEPVVFSNHFTRIRTRTELLLPGFLAAWLNHQWIKGVFASICNRWVGQSAVKSSKVMKLMFPLPPLEDQIRLTSMLHDRMLLVEQARDALREQQEALDSMSGALLRQVFEGGIG